MILHIIYIYVYTENDNPTWGATSIFLQHEPNPGRVGMDRWLVVSTNPSEKYELVSWDHDIPNIWTVIKFHGSKPPTSMLYLNRTCWVLW